jgi:hypothetical protein
MKMRWPVAGLSLLLAASALAQGTIQGGTVFTVDQFKAAGHKPIEGARLRQMLVGNTGYVSFLADSGPATAGSVNAFYWGSADRVTYVVTAKDTGKRLVRPTTWRMNGDLYCIQILSGPPPRPGDSRPPATVESCTAFYDVGGVIYACSRDNRCDRLVRIVPGNPENM